MSSLDQIFVNMKASILEVAGRILPEGAIIWVSIIFTISVLAAIAPLIMMYLTWFERKVLARMQNRFGPDRVGVYGLLQPLADGLKMLIKEDLRPIAGDKLLHTAAPILALVPALLLFAVIPFGRNMSAANLNVGLLYIFAISSISAFAIFMGGWASRSKFSMLGAMRSVAQVISYEVPGVLSVVAIIVVVGTLSIGGIVDAQSQRWFIFTPWGFVGCIIFFLCGVAEVNRTPFDMPEAESELVGGFHTEYSGMKFALWYMAEFLEAFAVCAFTVTLFLGGWHGPGWPFWSLVIVIAALVGTAQRLPMLAKGIGVLSILGLGFLYGSQAIPSWIWFLIKTYSLLFVLVWFRGTFPRLRVDQLMGLAWKFLLPMTLVNIIAAGLWVWFPFPIGTSICSFTLIISAWILVRINSPAPLKKRTYLFAE